jgi:hypothetical protein
LAVCLVVGSGLARAQWPQPLAGQSKPKGTSTFRGRVVAAASRQPLRRATVIFFSDTLRLTWATLSDADGWYEMKELPAGQYAVSATRLNYTWAAYGSDRVLGLGAPITIADGETLDGIDIELQRAGVITGRIVDEFGDPVAGVLVGVSRFQTAQGQRRLTRGRTTTTNDLGEYRLSGLTPGESYLSASWNRVSWLDTTDTFAYADTYYPGTGRLADARKLTIAPGRILDGIDMTLRPVRAARITGIVVDSQGQPFPDAEVVATERFGGSFHRTRAGPDGLFELGGLAPGEFIVRADPTFGTGDSASGRLVVSVNGDDVRALQLVVRPPTLLRGRIAIHSIRAAAPDMSAVRVNAWLEDEAQRTAAVEKDGTFEIKVPAGHVVLRTSGPAAEWQLRRVLLNGVDVTDGGLDVPAADLVAGATVELTDAVTELTGMVATTAIGRPRRFVLVFAQDPSLWGLSSRYVGLAETTRDGAYRLRLAPGRYYAVALADVDRNEWHTPDLFWQVRDDAVAISLAEGETKTVDLPLLATR